MQRIAICNGQFKRTKSAVLNDVEIEVLNFFRYGIYPLEYKEDI